MGEPYPSALMIASLESVSSNNNVLHRLVRPLADGSGVQSTDRLVNVIPHRRTYCFERKEQLDSFREEILRRPLVIQPILHFGRGFGPSCGACYDDEPWVVMINQTHPKILGRLQMGMDLARSAISKGQSVEIKFRFGKMIQRVYQEHLRQKELGEAQEKSGLARLVASFLIDTRFCEWDHGDLILRSHGLSAKLKANTPLMVELNNLDSQWEFEDIGMHDMVWSQQHPDSVFPRPHLATVSEDEIRAELPGWTVNEVTPLEAIGESAPQQNYSYAQAGRLYASFRKTRGHRPTHASQGRDIEEKVSHDPQGAEAMPDYSDRLGHYGAESSHDYWGEHEEGATAMPYSDENWSRPGDEAGWHYSHSGYDQLDAYNNRQQYNTQADFNPEYDHEHQQSSAHQDYWSGHNQHSPSYIMSQPDKYGHVMPQVHILQPRELPHHDTAHLLHKQDSDRSSRSTNADSGYCPSTDDLGHQRSRGESYDLNDPTLFGVKSRTTRAIQERYNNRLDSTDNFRKEPQSYNGDYQMNQLSKGHSIGDGLDNPAFSMTVSSKSSNQQALQNHRAMVEKMINHSNMDHSSGISSSPPHSPPAHIAESFI